MLVSEMMRQSGLEKELFATSWDLTNVRIIPSMELGMIFKIGFLSEVFMAYLASILFDLQVMTLNVTFDGSLKIVDVVASSIGALELGDSA